MKHDSLQSYNKNILANGIVHVDWYKYMKKQGVTMSYFS